MSVSSLRKAELVTTVISDGLLRVNASIDSDFSHGQYEIADYVHSILDGWLATWKHRGDCVLLNPRVKARTFIRQIVCRLELEFDELAVVCRDKDEFVDYGPVYVLVVESRYSEMIGAIVSEEEWAKKIAQS